MIVRGAALLTIRRAIGDDGRNLEGRKGTGRLKEFKMFRSSKKRLAILFDDWYELIAIGTGIVSLVLMIILALIFIMTGPALGAAPQQKVFPSAEEASRALIEAAKAKDTKPLLDILGPEARSFLDTGDAVSDRASRERFIQFYQESNSLVKSGDSKVSLEVGKDKWPFPIPIVKESTGWRFDTKAGREEVINRRIGRNELDVIQVSLAFVDAQLEYYQRNPLKEPLLQYAQKFLSSQGKKDGLYWETKTGEEPSPFGALVAQARAEGYKAEAGRPNPYHGYYYKMLTGQGTNAQGGAYEYLVRGKMIGGFGMVAYPAQYGASGVMTFLVSHDGVVYEKDLGPNTAQTAASMSKFNPDKSWKEAAKIR